MDGDQTKKKKKKKKIHLELNTSIYIGYRFLPGNSCLFVAAKCPPNLMLSHSFILRKLYLQLKKQNNHKTIEKSNQNIIFISNQNALRVAAVKIQNGCPPCCYCFINLLVVTTISMVESADLQSRASLSNLGFRHVFI